MDLQPALQSVTLDDSCRRRNESIFIKGPPVSKNKAKAMMDVIKNHGFWRDLVLGDLVSPHSCSVFSAWLILLFRIKQHLERLAIAANITQSAFCRLDEVLLTFGALTITYADLRDRCGGDQSPAVPSWRVSRNRGQTRIKMSSLQQSSSIRSSNARHLNRSHAFGLRASIAYL